MNGLVARRALLLGAAAGLTRGAAGPVLGDEIRDRSRRLLGRISVRGNGTLEARDSQNRLLGTFDPRTSETRDAANRLLSYGNTLPALIWCPCGR